MDRELAVSRDWKSLGLAGGVESADADLDGAGPMRVLPTATRSHHMLPKPTLDENLSCIELVRRGIRGGFGY